MICDRFKGQLSDLSEYSKSFFFFFSASPFKDLESPPNLPTEFQVLRVSSSHHTLNGRLRVGIS